MGNGSLARYSLIWLVALILAGCGSTAMNAAQTTAVPTNSSAGNVAATSAPATTTATTAAMATSGAPQATPSSAGGAAATPAANGTTRTIIDQKGRTVKLPATIARVATNYPAVNQIVYMLGAGDEIVATVPTITQNEIFVKIYPRLKTIPAPMGADINMEALLATQPDVVFLQAATKPDVIDGIERAGIAAVIVGSFANPAELQKGVSFIGDVLGGQSPAIAQQFATYYQANIKRVTAITDTIPQAERLKAYYTASTPFETEGKGSIVTDWMAQGGARNMAAENGVPASFTNVTVEDIISWNPDVIVCRDPSVQKLILADPRFKTIPAVQNNKVLINPRGVFVWGVRSAEEALQTLWFAQTLHPDRFTDLNLSQEIKNFYTTFYHYNLSDDEVQTILHPTTP